MNECFSCKYCGMDMDMDLYCAHPEVLKTNEWGSSTNVVRGALYMKNDNRSKLPHFNLCGQEGKLFELRAQSAQ